MIIQDMATCSTDNYAPLQQHQIPSTLGDHGGSTRGIQHIKSTNELQILYNALRTTVRLYHTNFSSLGYNNGVACETNPYQLRFRLILNSR